MARCIDCDKRCGFLSFREKHKCSSCRKVICERCVINSEGKEFCSKCWQKRASCFIATACYGVDSKELEIFRSWRDEYLLKKDLGIRFVNFYYKTSPPIANFISDKTALKKIVRAGLYPAKRFLKKKYSKKEAF